MAFLGSYEIEVRINNLLLESSPLGYSFSMRDSIHNFFSEMTFGFEDLSGVLQDSLLNSEGIHFDLKYGIKDEVSLNNSYSLIHDELPSTYSNDSIGGKLLLTGLNSYYDSLEVKSAGYNGRVSDIATTVMTPNNFKAINKNDTGSSDIWYQPLINQQEFIEKFLLPNSFSNNAKDTPFFCWINSNNEFNFRNYNSLTETSSKQTMELKNISQASLDYSNILDISRMKTGALYNKKLRNRLLFSRNRTTGEIEQLTDSIGSYPSGSQSKNLPIVNDTLTSGVYDLLYTETEPGLQETFKGRKINSMKDTFFLERYIIKTIFNPTLKAGDLITLKIPISIKGKGSSEFSDSIGGEYLIERSDHTWNGKNTEAFSNFIVSRKFMNIPNTSNIKHMFIGGA